MTCTIDHIWNISGVLVGVAAGWSITQLTGLLTDRKRIRDLKSMLKAELESVACQLAPKRDIIRQILAGLERGGLLPGTSVHSLRVTYDNFGAELFPHLTVKERNCLHVIYEQLRIVDDVLDSFFADFASEDKRGVLEDPMAAFKSLLADLDMTCEKLKELIKSYLDGNPLDVFWTEKEDQK